MLDHFHSRSQDAFNGILTHLSFNDLCRIARLNPLLRSAASSDEAWGRFFHQSVDSHPHREIGLKIIFTQYYERQLAELISSLNDLKKHINAKECQWEHMQQEQRATLQRLLAHSISSSPIDLSDPLTEFNSVFRKFSQQYPTKTFEFFYRLENIESVSVEYEGLLKFLRTDFNAESVNDIWSGHWSGPQGWVP